MCDTDQIFYDTLNSTNDIFCLFVFSNETWATLICSPKSDTHPVFCKRPESEQSCRHSSVVPVLSWREWELLVLTWQTWQTAVMEVVSGRRQTAERPHCLSEQRTVAYAYAYAGCTLSPDKRTTSSEQNALLSVTHTRHPLYTWHVCLRLMAPTNSNTTLCQHYSQHNGT